MFGDIGLSELLVVAFVVLVLVRPEDVPVIMRRAGVLYAHFQMNMRGLWNGFLEQMGLLNAPTGPALRKGRDEA